MTRAPRVSIMLGIILLCLAGAANSAQAQDAGTVRTLKIMFTSAPDRARFNFAFRDQKVSGRTTATKVFTLVDNFEVTVVFSKQGFRDCQKMFHVRWLNADAGVLIVEGEKQQQFSFSAGASPPMVNCELERDP